MGDNSYELPDDSIIELQWNYLNLPQKRSFRFRPCTERLAEKLFTDWLERRHSDYRIRYVFEPTKREVHLSARLAYNIDMAEKFLKPYIEESIRYKNPHILERQRELTYGRTLIT
jgi:hypothetical protein